MSKALGEYFAALDRLKKNKPTKVPKGMRITNDAVAVEAGRRKGTIKKSRPVFAELVEAIKTAQEERGQISRVHQDQLDRLAASDRKHARLYEEGMAREVTLLREIDLLKSVQQQNQSKSSTVTRLHVGKGR